MRNTLLALWAVFISGCGYQYYTGPLHPVEEQASSMSVADDGTVTFVQGRFEVWLRPMSDEELNRLYAAHSQDGPKSTNPYTFGNTAFSGPEQERQRFSVFRLGVKNYEYPKVRIDPARIALRAANGREYWSLNFEQLATYYRAYAIGYRGNEYVRYQERRDLVRRTLFLDEDIFSGQEQDRYIVFPALHPDVGDIEVTLYDAALRFDFRNEPIETIDITFRFTRDTGRIYKDGRVVLN